jgi:hypothetical protein
MRHSRSAIALAFALLAVPPLAAAQPSPDFMFGSPKGMIGVRSGWLFASANSDLFTFVQRHLTVDRKDFNAPAIGVDVEVAMGPRLSAIGGFDFSHASKDSEYRDFVDNQRLPITQTTTLTELNLSGSVKVAITPRGREISRRAFIPAAVTPYVGAGGGFMRYKFVQFGDFIDVESTNSAIFEDTFQTSLSQRRRALSLVERDSRPRLHRLRPDRPRRPQSNSRRSLHVLGAKRMHP